jgi:hypothetical protein
MAANWGARRIIGYPQQQQQSVPTYLQNIAGAAGAANWNPTQITNRFGSGITMPTPSASSSFLAANPVAAPAAPAPAAPAPAPAAPVTPRTPAGSRPVSNDPGNLYYGQVTYPGGGWGAPGGAPTASATPYVDPAVSAMAQIAGDLWNWQHGVPR